MDAQVTPQSPYAFQSWQDAAADFSVHDPSDAADALQSLREAILTNLTKACGTAPDRLGRAPGTIGAAVDLLAKRIADLPDERLRPFLGDGEEDQRLGYRLSTTRIVRSGNTGVLFRAREVTGQLILGEVEIHACLQAVRDVLQTTIHLGLAQGDEDRSPSPDDLVFRFVRGDGQGLEVVSRASAPALPEGFSFQRGRLSLKSTPANGTEASILLSMRGTPEDGSGT
jgi:hypothetical protein